MPSYKDILLRMHEFYFLEARHQRLMMWETVKWFTPILTLLLGSLGKFIIDYRYKMDFSVAVVLFSLSVFGGILCIIALHLLKMFYDTNLQYISMFIKVENELEARLKQWMRETDDPFDTGERDPATGMLKLGQEFIHEKYYR